MIGKIRNVQLNESDVMPVLSSVCISCIKEWSRKAATDARNPMRNASMIVDCRSDRCVVRHL